MEAKNNFIASSSLFLHLNGDFMFYKVKLILVQFIIKKVSQICIETENRKFYKSVISCGQLFEKNHLIFHAKGGSIRSS